MLKDNEPGNRHQIFQCQKQDPHYLAKCPFLALSKFLCTLWGFSHLQMPGYILLATCNDPHHSCTSDQKQPIFPLGARQMTQWLRALAPPEEDLSSVLSTHKVSYTPVTPVPGDPLPSGLLGHQVHMQ